MAVFAANDVAETTAGALAARVIDWRDTDDQPAALGAERSEYQRAGRVPGPCNAPSRRSQSCRRLSPVQRAWPRARSNGTQLGHKTSPG
jgi:NADPH-dependent 2,4-dienoyl-CoA reductase/sulfur reductase-like enzyme